MKTKYKVLLLLSIGIVIACALLHNWIALLCACNATMGVLVSSEREQQRDLIEKQFLDYVKKHKHE
jgi:hypothetical protein